MKNTKRAVSAARKAVKLPEWCYRSMVNSPVFFTLVTTQEMFLREQRRMGIAVNALKPWKAENDTATCFHYSETADYKESCIVAINAAAVEQKYDAIQVVALLAHESMHIWRFIRKAIGEGKPSSEFEAYSLQNILQSLLYEYARQTGRPT